ncbi:JM39 [macacine gammaherpesvirus 11]|uniref:JM39 n=2 Tax=macacine gammaherpesvirus 11 TaxID=2560570 RepID=G9JML7_9GAMA|nr:JM39 [Macaca fuscata rhadinovirus]AAT00016.1 JM39 [Macaca fuscata rhadinovirus]AEW87564.1 JM39 [Macaca fuscata rhadinovirus]AEW87734.1 JM39 [Macaca fuscata rhadinovirus]
MFIISFKMISFTLLLSASLNIENTTSCSSIVNDITLFGGKLAICDAARCDNVHKLSECNSNAGKHNLNNLSKLFKAATCFTTHPTFTGSSLFKFLTYKK